MSEAIPGLETIRGLVGEPPREIPVDIETMSEQQVLMQDWNSSFVAIIPYCFKCKAPLTWHTPPDEDLLFTCPTCSRRWIKGSSWPHSKRQIAQMEHEAKIKLEEEQKNEQ
jgi:hypothetical protein